MEGVLDMVLRSEDGVVGSLRTRWSRLHAPRENGYTTPGNLASWMQKYFGNGGLGYHGVNENWLVDQWEHDNYGT